MSAKSIALYESHRASKTMPPPAGKAMAAGIRDKASDIRRIAASLLAEANDLDTAAEALEKL